MNKRSFSTSALGLVAGVLGASSIALAQPLVNEDGTTHVAYLGAEQSPTGIVWFRLDPQNNGVNWTVEFDRTEIVAATVSCPEGTREVGRDYADPEVPLPQFALGEPKVLDTPIEGQINDVDPAFFDQLVAGSCYASIETVDGFRYNGQIVSAQ